MLHLDLWWRGQNISLDPGTYSYNAPDPWNNTLAGTAYHNTVTVDGLDQMENYGRFLWLPWLRGQVHNNKVSSSGSLAYWEGEHDGYGRLVAPVSYRRAIVRLGDEHWLVLDALSSRETHNYILHWLLPDLRYEWNHAGKRLVLHTPAGDFRLQLGTVVGTAASSLVRADPNSARGWRAPYYSCREPALSLHLTASVGAVWFWTVCGPEPVEVTVTQARLQIHAASWRAVIDLGTNNTVPLVKSLSLFGGASASSLKMGF